MQPSDLGRVVAVGDPAVSPDGSRIAVVVTRFDLEANRTRSAIHTVATADGATHELTQGEHRDAHPRWSPSGDRLAFIRTDEHEHAPTQILVLPMASPGEPLVIATLAEPPDDLDWSPDGTRLACCARVPEVEPGTPDRDRPPRHITTLIASVDDEGWTVDRRRQVHVVPADGAGPARAVTTGPFDHSGARWSPDGRTIAVAAARHEGWDLDERVDLWLLDPDPADDDPVDPTRLTDGTLVWSHPSWSPDGTRLAAIVMDVDTGWHNSRLAVVPVAGGAGDDVGGGWVDVAPELDRTFAPYPGERAPIWIDGGAALLAAIEDRGRVLLVRAAPDGSTPPVRLTDGDQVVAGYDQVGDVLATVVTDPARPGELEVGPHRTSFTAGFVAACPPAPVQRFEVPSPAGDGDIDCWLVTPQEFEGGRADSARWPLLLAVHGGPMSQYGDKWFDEFNLLAAAGFVVLASNPHGSSGREDAWQRAIRSPAAAVEPGTGWGGIDADDLLAVVDATLERWPELDPARVGVLGGSYGGFMTSWLLARTDRFAGGCSERAVNNLLSEEWSSDLGGTFHRELGVSHLDHPEEYVRMSPVTYARTLTAPILIIHSEQDLRCHPEQADALFTALRLLGHPDVEYWRFPGEGHELSRSGSPFHRVRRAELINAFFERTIGAGPK